MSTTPTRTPARAPSLGRPPLLLLVPGSVGAALLVVPLVALVLDTPWSDLGAQLADPAVRDALWLSGLTSALTVVLCVLLGTPLAWLLARVEFPGRRLLRGLVAVPLWTIPYTTTAVVLAHTFVSLPFFVLSVEGALRTAGERFDVVAATLGADRWTTFRRVTLPLALPGVLAGCVLAWARSLGEFGATITFAGNFPGTTQTMPSLIYTTLQADPAAARTLSMLLLVVSIGVLVGLRRRWLVPS